MSKPLKGKGARSPRLTTIKPGSARSVILIDPTGAQTEPLFDTLGDPREGTSIRMPDGRIFTVKSKNEQAIIVHATRDDLIYNGALEVARRHGGPPVGAGVDEEITSSGPATIKVKAGKTKAARTGAPAKVVEVSPEMKAFVAKTLTQKLGSCQTIRNVATQFMDASVAEIRSALPDLNPSTVSIQVKKARST